MIEAILILNKLGLLRFIKIYSDKENQIEREELIKKVFNTLNQSKDTNIIYDFEYLGENRKLVFRLFGTIYIAMILDDLENELAILDYLNVVMQVLDEIFKGVSELHLIVNPEKIYLLVDEMISAGTIIETNKLEIISNYNDKLRDDENYKFFVNK